MQTVDHGKNHIGALCVVASSLAERAWAVMNHQMPYVICDTDGAPVTTEQAAAIIVKHWTVPPDVRSRRRSQKGKAPKPSPPYDVNGATFPTTQSSDPPAAPSTATAPSETDLVTIDPA